MAGALPLVAWGAGPTATAAVEAVTGSDEMSPAAPGETPCAKANELVPTEKATATAKHSAQCHAPKHLLKLSPFTLCNLKYRKLGL